VPTPDTETQQQDLDGNGTIDFSRTFTRTQDALLRSTGYTLKPSNGLPAVIAPGTPV
jgi:hypothetical protein